MMHTTRQTAGAAPAAPATSTSRPRAQARARVLLGRAARLVFLAAAVAIGAWGIVRTPWYRERRLSRMTVAELQRQRGSQRDDPTLLYYLGKRLNEAGRYTEADPLLRNAVGIEPDSPRLRDEWARALLGSGLTTAAFGQLREFAGTHPNLADAHYLLGKFYCTQHSMRRASEELAQTVRLDAGNADAWALLATAYDGLGDAERARTAAEQAVRRAPDNAGYHLAYGSLLERANQPAASRGEYERAAALAPRQSDAHREYARWLLEATSRPADLAVAEAEARRAAQLAPDDGGAQLVLGRILDRRGCPREAVAPLARAMDLLPNDPAPVATLQHVYRTLGRTQEAEALHATYLARQSFVGERDRLWEALRVAPDSAPLHTKLGRLLGLHGDVDGCVHHYSAAFHLPVDAPRVLIAAARDLTEGKHADASLPLARRAAAVSAASPAAHEVLGDALLGVGQAHAAAEEYVKTAGWLPERLPILKKKLADYKARLLGAPSPAERAFRDAVRQEQTTFGPKRITPEGEALAKRAVSLEPTNPTYLRYLLHIQVARRNDEQAIMTARRILALSPADSMANTMLAILLVDRARTPAELGAVEDLLQRAAPDTATEATRHYALGLLAMRRAQADAAVRELREAARLDPNADVTFYKLSMAEAMAGNTKERERAMATFRAREAEKSRESQLLGAIALHPDRPPLYDTAVRYYEARGMKGQAEAIRAEARRRFGALTAHPRDGTTRP